MANFLHDCKTLPAGTCRCGEKTQEPKETVHHVLGCKTYRGLWYRHDSVVSILSQLSADAGATVQQELVVGDNSKDRIDLKVHLGGTTYFADASCVHPLGNRHQGHTHPSRPR
jgi:hypothetical protein